MKNIFLLPTEESSRIGRFVDTQKLLLRSEKDIPRGENVNIYITSEEEVNVNDYVIVSCSEEEIEEARFVTGYYNEQFLFDGKSQIHMDYCKKIILTTDFRLAPDVQKIDDEFLEWFVENPGCEFVHAYNDRVVGYEYDNYTIIIPIEETKPIDNLDERFKRDMKMIVMPLDNDNISEEDPLQQILTAHMVPKKYFGTEEEGNVITDWLDKYGDPKIEKQVEREAKIMMEKETKPHSFCETPEEKCTMNYCDENGCQNRKRNLVETENYPIGGYAPGSYWCGCVSCKKKFMGDKRAIQCESCAVEMLKKYRLETLEEAAANLADPNICKTDNWIAGAKWQLENMPIHIYAENTYVHIEDGTIKVEKNDHTIMSYSEDDLREAFKQSRQCKIFEKDMPPVYEEFEDWFKQFKKK